MRIYLNVDTISYQTISKLEIYFISGRFAKQLYLCLSSAQQR